MDSVLSTIHVAITVESAITHSLVLCCAILFNYNDYNLLRLYLIEYFYKYSFYN